jgi:hypothetical protein
MSPRSQKAKAALLVASVAGTLSCRDLSGFSTGSGSFEGEIVGADFVRWGIGATTDGGAATRLCLTLDANHLQDTPGALSTSDGLFHAAPMRTIPQIWQDPLSTLSFGEGRLKNLVYVVNATSPLPEGGNDVFAVVSLMQSGNVEVRLLRGAPPPDGSVPTDHLFAVFELQRQSTPCSY